MSSRSLRLCPPGQPGRSTRTTPSSGLCPSPQLPNASLQLQSKVIFDLLSPFPKCLHQEEVFMEISCTEIKTLWNSKFQDLNYSIQENARSWKDQTKLTLAQYHTLVNVVTQVERLYLWEPKSILEQTQSPHRPPLLRNDSIRARVESIKKFSSLFVHFSPLSFGQSLHHLIILQQDSLHLKKKPLFQVKGKHTIRFTVALTCRKDCELLFLPYTFL